jgi:NADH:ubiquinone oxidoreductase subunit D
MEFYERVSGARMHAAFYRPNEANLEAISPFMIEDIAEFLKNCFTTLSEIHNSLTYNKLWKQRLVNIGAFSYKTVLNYGLSGVMSRSVGIKRDIRLSKLETYANYYYLNFRSFVGNHGDSYDRFLIRMNEMSESLNICNQIINKVKNKEIIDCEENQNKDKNYILDKNTLINYINYDKNNCNNLYASMENVISHFKVWSSGFSVKPG